GVGESARAGALDRIRLRVAVAPAGFLYFARRYDEALTALDVAVAMDSTSGLVQRTRAAILDRLGRHEEAVRCLCRWLDSQQLQPVAAGGADAHAARGITRPLRYLIPAPGRQRPAGPCEPAPPPPRPHC